MMELTCAFILISASLVIATPHGYGGYGVKGGASARAESSASAGAFPGIPVAVPLGAGYSGSFSKSSSSSSASSSASSSSSSSSFSYNGSGAGGYGLHGGAPGHGGCSSGNCQNAGVNGVPTLHGSSAHGYNSANAAASAEAAAGALSGSGCKGASCDGNSEKCTSGSCKTGPTAIDSDSSKCTSGQCGSASENGASPTDDGSNDIRAVTDSAHNTNHHSSGSDESSAHNGADSNCFNGKCGSSSSKPNHYGHGSENSYKDSNNQQGSSSDIGITSHYQKPSTHLETPKESSKCNSGNCNPGLGEPGHESLPSSYNVPIHGAYDKEPKPSCDGVKCENQPKRPTENSVTKGPSSFDYTSSTNCIGSSCFGTAANQVTGGPSGTVRPGNTDFGHSLSHVPVAPGHIEHGKPSDANKKLPNDKLPPYTGGFGGPAGVLTPNDVPVTVNPNQAHANTPQSGKPLGSAPTGCNSPSCSGYPSGSGPTGGLVPTGTYNDRPGGDISSDKLPAYTGGFGGPSGTLKPSGFDVHAAVTNKPTYAHPGSPSYTTQPAGNIGTPGCQAGGNCGGSSPTADATSGASAQSGHYGTTKPNNSINSPNDKLPTYTGGFGGPGGVFNPDKHGIHVTGPSSPGYTPSGTYNTPSASGHPGGCNTPNCHPSFSSTVATESFGVTKPGLSPHLPAYTSSYDSPGVHRPNEISGPASTPSFTHPQSPSSPGSYSPDCKTGNCAKNPISGPSGAAPNHPQYTGGFGGPSGTFKPEEHNSAGCKAGNCAHYPTSGPSAGAYGQSGSFGVTKPNTDVNTAAPNQPQYTGGFGGPSSTLKPGEHNSLGCKTGNCANYPISGPSAGANAQPGSFGITKPNTDAAPNQPQYMGGFGGPSGTLKPSEHNSPGCDGGNCANYPITGPSAGANAQPGSFGVTKPNTEAAPNQPQYTGGFGGPSGTLKPSEHNSPGCNGGNCAHYPISGPSADANAQPGSSDFTKPHTDAAPNQPHYTGGFGGPSGTLKPSEHNSPGCNGGNCANYPISGPSAGANAQPGSFGVTKPVTDVNSVAPNQPQYTGGFGGPSGTLKPGGHSYVTPSTGSATTNCGTPNCFGSPAANAHAAAGAGANVQLGSHGITKPSGGNNPSNDKPNYNGGFGGAAGILKPNDYTVPALSPAPNNKPTGASTPTACISGNCNPQAQHSSAPHAHNDASGGAHATAAATAEANAVAYTGGFGGPPGVLAPFDDGKIGSLPTHGGQGHGPQIGGAHGSYNANIHSQHGTIPGANGGPTRPAVAHGNTGAQAGSTAGAAAYSGAAAGATAGAHGYNPHGSYNHAGNVKGGSPCGGGCGGTGGGAYNGGSTLGASSGPGFPKLVLSDGGGITLGPAGKSLAGANAFGVGGSFASSSASAHASAGSYTKGGYGKR